MDRSIQLTRGVIDMETGEFPATLATNGPASDPHILDIRTLRVPEHIPMFPNHDADPIRQLGSMHSPHKVGQSSKLGGASLKMIGRMDLDGDNALGDIRRDVARRISVGDISQMSVRWGHDEMTIATPRNDEAALKKVNGGFAFSKLEGGWEVPMFIQHAPVLEGSIVGLGADEAALIGRSQDTNLPQHVRDFYRMLTTAQRVEPEELEKEIVEQIEEFRDLDTSEEPIQPEPIVEPEDTTGRENPGHSGEPLGTPAPFVESGSSAQLTEIAAFIRDLEQASKAQLDAGVARLLYERRGVL